MKIQHDNFIQIVESFLNILLNKMGEKEYRNFIKSNPILVKYDNMMSEYMENEIPYELIEQVHLIVKKKVETLSKESIEEQKSDGSDRKSIYDVMEQEITESDLPDIPEPQCFPE